MSVKTSYEIDRAGTRAFLDSRELTPGLRAIAEQGKTIAEGLSPVDTGDYASSWDVRDGHAIVEKERRVCAEIVNTSDHAAAVEFGYKGRFDRHGKNAQRVLGRALDALRE